LISGDIFITGFARRASHRKAEKWLAEKWRLKRGWSSFFCPAFFCWRVRVPGFYNCVLKSGQVT
jgi:hypothetical protein